MCGTELASTTPFTKKIAETAAREPESGIRV